MAQQTSRRRLATALVAVGTVAVILLVAVLVLMTRGLLERTAQAQLASVLDGRVAAVERGVEELQSGLASIAADPGLVAAVADLVAAGTGDDAEAVAAQVSTHGAFLQDLLASTPGSDLLVLAPATDEVVYAVAGSVDAPSAVGARDESADDSADGSTVRAVLGDVVDRLPAVPVGDAVVVDGAPVDGMATPPVMLVAATVRSGLEVVGVVVMTVPAQHLTDLVGADGNWEQLGLGDTGDAVVVGSNATLRSEPRAWTQDPDAYLALVAEVGDDGAEVARAIERTGSPVFVQELTNPAVAAAIRGEEFLGTVDGVAGTPVRAGAAAVEAGGLNWGVVVAQASSAASATVWAFLRWVALLLAIVVPLIILAAVLLSRALTRPIPALVEVSSELARGNLHVDVPDLGRNEFGDVATQLGAVADELRRQQQAVVAEEDRIQGILSAVVPARLMDRVRRGEHRLSDVLETATVVSVSLVGLPEPTGADQEVILEATTRITADLESLALRSGVEAVRASARQQLFLAGLGAPDPDVEAAATFATRVSDVVLSAGRHFGLEVRASVGVAAGTVGTGLLGTTQMAFGIWGDPPGQALALDELARPGEVLVAAVVADALGDLWRTTPLPDLVDLQDEDVVAHVLQPLDDLTGDPVTTSRRRT